MDSESIMQLRREYTKLGLDEKSINKNPVVQFEKWFQTAVNQQLIDPNAMVLATVDENGIPSARIVLLKDFDESGFVFFTNYESQKGREIQNNPNVSMVFYWAELERQIRINGVAEKISFWESEEYFHSRPFESQIGALASLQSGIIESRDFLEQKFNQLLSKYKDGDVPMPDFWGGYRVLPSRFEFWQGRTGRLHDRIVYEKKDDQWNIFRLSP